MEAAGVSAPALLKTRLLPRGMRVVLEGEGMRQGKDGLKSLGGIKRETVGQCRVATLTHF